MSWKNSIREQIQLETNHEPIISKTHIICFRVLKVPYEVFLFFSLNLSKLVMVDDEKACFGILDCGFLHAIPRLLPLMATFLAFLPAFFLFLRLSLRLRQSSRSHSSLSLRAIIIYTIII